MKPFLLLLALAVSALGCIPLRQGSRVVGPDYPPVLLVNDQYLLVGTDMHRERIIAEQSYIISPGGKRYGIQVEPHQFDIDQKFEALRADVYACDADGSRLRPWSNGIWGFNFVVETNGMTRTIDQQWKYWTFYYNPIIHGPPN